MRTIRMMTAITVIALLLSCSDVKNHDRTESGDDADTLQRQQPPTTASSCNCYMNVVGRDTMVASLVQTGEMISGRMTFNNYQKDGSAGTVQGRADGNMLKLWYSFFSEGMHSVMEIYFRKEGDQLLRGLGPVDVKGDTAYFTDDAAVTYRQDQVFKLVDCDAIAGKYGCFRENVRQKEPY